MHCGVHCPCPFHVEARRERQIVAKMAEMNVDRRAACIQLAKEALERAIAIRAQANGVKQSGSITSEQLN